MRCHPDGARRTAEGREHSRDFSERAVEIDAYVPAAAQSRDAAQPQLAPSASVARITPAVKAAGCTRAVVFTAPSWSRWERWNCVQRPCRCPGGPLTQAELAALEFSWEFWARHTINCPRARVGGSIGSRNRAPNLPGRRLTVTIAGFRSSLAVALEGPVAGYDCTLDPSGRSTGPTWRARTTTGPVSGTAFRFLGVPSRSPARFRRRRRHSRCSAGAKRQAAA